MPAEILRADGLPVWLLGLGGTTETRASTVDRAFRLWIDYFFAYTLKFEGLVAGMSGLARNHREEVVIATGSEERHRGKLRESLESALHSLETGFIDIFYLEYVAPADSASDHEEALGEVLRWKQEGLIRYLGVSAHDRSLATALCENDAVDVLMHRYNMAHRKSESAVLPRDRGADTPVVTFTCTRWESLLRGHPDWDGATPTAGDCYRFALSHEAVRLALTAPANATELEENVKSVNTIMSASERENWSRYGDLHYGDGTDAFETRWP